MVKLSKPIKFLFFLTVFVVGSIFINSVYVTDSSQKVSLRTRKLSSVQLAKNKDYFSSEIKPILDQRCVVCHSCYSAPCQLKLTSSEGILRGAHKINLNKTTLKEKELTRLYTDANSIKEWRKKQFFPVVNFDEEDLNHLDENKEVNKNIRDSLFYSMIALNRGYKNLEHEVFNSSNIETHSCPQNETEFNRYAEARPNGNMPYGFPELTDEEFSKLQSWLELGSPGPTKMNKTKLMQPTRPDIIETWEKFFNDQRPRNKLVARYIYEHLFLANLEFQEMPGEFFNLVRARSFDNSGNIIEVATKHPYDDPIGSFTYKFRKVQETIVHKSHLRYELSKSKMLRFQEIFLNEAWDTTQKVANTYSNQIASNPFVIFQDIPAKSRYQFLLDNSLFFIMSFTKGPVCKGNAALSVINDHTFAFFLSPKIDLSVKDPNYLKNAAELLVLPAQKEDDSAYLEFKFLQMRYAKFRKNIYNKVLNRGMRLSDIWDGDGHNDQAVLTIFRHEDSAHVEKGAIGGIPKTALILDYPIMERIYYNLVAGFNPFGGIPHQLSTRLYMDNLRVEGEDLFLSFLPRKYANKLRESWYKGTIARAKMYLLNPYSGIDINPDITYKSTSLKKELILKILNEYLSPQARGIVDQINCCDESIGQGQQPIASQINSEMEIEDELKKITSRAENYVHYFPEFALLRIRMKSGDDLVYSIVKNIDYANVSFAIPGDSMRERQPENETLFFIKGFVGSYPNFFYVIDIDQLPDFFNDMIMFPKWAGLANSQSEGFIKLKKFIQNYGITRSNPQFWIHSDWFNREFKRINSKEAGILDLSRYKNLLKELRE